MAYMSASQFKSFHHCQAAAMAELRGEYVRPMTTSLLIGSYVDAHFEGTLNIFKAQHPDIFKRDGGLKSEFLQANTIISRIESDECYTVLLSGAKQVIRTGFIADVPFKIKIDSLLDAATVEYIVNHWPETAPALCSFDGPAPGAIVDLKIMRDLDPVWSDAESCRLPFVEAWGYDLQGAAYQAIEGRMLPFIIAPATKEIEPDMQPLFIDQDDLDAKLAEIEDFAPKYQAIKEGKLEPERCEKCDYCRSTRKVSSIINYRELALC